MKRFAAISVIMTFVCMTAAAQRIGNFVRESFLLHPDSLYIADLNNYFGLRMSVFQKGSAFSIDDMQTISDLQYTCADSSASLSVGIGYKWLSVGVGFGLGFFDRNRVGNKFDYSTQIHLPAITIKLQGNIYEGYCLDNASTMIKNWPMDKRYLRKDIITSVLRVSADYYFNYTKYSRKALTSQGQMQRRTAGSVLTGVIFNHDVVAGDSSLIPSDVKTSEFAYTGNVSRVRNMFVGADGGYAISAVFPKGWFINGQFVSGLAYNRSQVQHVGEPNQLYQGVALIMQGEFSGGLNKEKWFICLGGSIFSIQSSIGKEGASINTVNSLFQATLAYRIKIEKDYSVGQLARSQWQRWREIRVNRKLEQSNL